jgi:hypothetical protein
LHLASFGSTQQGGFPGLAHPLSFSCCPLAFQLLWLKTGPARFAPFASLKKVYLTYFVDGISNKKENKGKAGFLYPPQVAGKVKPFGF